MKLSRTIVFLLLLSSLGARASTFGRVSSELTDKTPPSPACLQELPLDPAATATPYSARAGELDEFLGDTLIIGRTYYDLQANATVGRMLQYNPWGYEGTGVVYCAYADMYTTGGVRHVHYQEIVADTLRYPDVHMVNTGNRAGFPTVARSPITEEGGCVITYHGRASAEGLFETKVASEYIFFPGVFVEFDIPWDENYEIIWPKSAMDGDSAIHILSTSNDQDAYEVYYTKMNADLETPMFTSQISPQLVTDRGEFISGDIACSPDGQRVAVAQPINRAKLLGEEEPWWLDQDLYLWVDENRGATFEWGHENAINVTDFIDPDPDPLPDTVAACQDTFRLYMDVCVYFDESNILHLAFSTLEFFYYYNNGEGTAHLTGQLWYWNEADQLFVRIADGDFWNNTALGANQINLQRPSLYKDPESGMMYCLYQQFGIPGDTLTTGDSTGLGRDRSEGGFLNAELFITATPYGDHFGKYWYPGVNITESRGTNGRVPAGECRSERDASISLNNDGDYLNILYQLDLDPGTFVFDDAPEGSSTDNPIVYGKISKQELYYALEANLYETGHWVIGHPLHIDGTQFWDDPEEWIVSVDEKPLPLLPEEFSLNEVYPNPFNSSARVRFDLKERGHINLAVYDILGRQVATILNQTFDAGSHEALFEGHNLASGVYFIRLSSGNSHQARKITLIK